MDVDSTSQQMEDFFTLRTVLWNGGSVKMIDQTVLPGRLLYRCFTRGEAVGDAIRRMVVRGAPVIRGAAAIGDALAAGHPKAPAKVERRRGTAGGAARPKTT